MKTKRLGLFGAVVCGALAAAPAWAQGQGKAEKPQGKADKAAPVTAVAQLKDAQGKDVGEVRAREVARGVILDIRVSGLPEGEHAFHIHEVGECEPPFKSAGGHFAPKKNQHGIENPKGKHAGDLPNLHIPSSGQLQVTVFTDAVTLKPGGTTVFDVNGSAFVIHAGADDYRSDPAGNAGDRIACGVIQRK